MASGNNPVNRSDAALYSALQAGRGAVRTCADSVKRGRKRSR